MQICVCFHSLQGHISCILKVWSLICKTEGEIGVEICNEENLSMNVMGKKGRIKQFENFIHIHCKFAGE